MILHTKRLNRILIFGVLIIFYSGINRLNAAEVRWLAVGDLHNWFSSVGCEIEIGRTGAQRDQLDGLRYPAMFTDQDIQAGKGLWIGAADYNDPVYGRTFPYKVMVAGPRKVDEAGDWMPQEFILYGKSDHPLVMVDGLLASELEFMDINVVKDQSIPGDRMLYNVVQTGMGVEMERKIHAFTNPFHQNYFIHEYTFTNNGICNADGSITHDQTLKDFMVMWQFRLGFNREACNYGRNILPQDATWGRNTVNDIMGMGGTATYDPDDKMNPLRAVYAFGGKHSGATDDNGVGGAWWSGDGHLTSVMFGGFLTLHADKSPTDPSNDPYQPSGSMYIASDLPVLNYENNAADKDMMSGQYEWMNKGHPDPTQAEDLGYDWANLDPGAVDDANQWNNEAPGSAGGFSSSMSYGPWDLAPGQSVRIVWAEAVAGLSREESYRIGKAFVNGDISENEKDLYVYSGRDSLIKTFWNAYENYESGMAFPEPPPPPGEFIVTSGGDRITFTWSDEPENYSGFSGYKIFRAKNDPSDSTYHLIADIPKGQIEVDDEGMNFFEDRSAQRGFDYYYYLIAYDDGSNDPEGRVLYSSKFYTLTSEAASLQRMPGTSLDQIRIVPNPYHIRAQDIQYGRDVGSANRISFFNLPPVCTIKIFTERGDLIKTIEHTDNSGDETWNSLTETRQTIVSGLYIAYFETPEGKSTYKKFIVIR